MKRVDRAARSQSDAHRFVSLGGSADLASCEDLEWCQHDLVLSDSVRF